MQPETPEPVQVLRTAAWIWISYLAALAGVDVLIYAGRQAEPVLWYHLITMLPALLFLGLAYSNWAKTRPGALVPWMVLLISVGPLLLNHLVDLRLPAAPLSNLEGMVLRQLPVLFIGLVLVAWHYNLAVMIFYSVGVNLFELIVVRQVGPFDPQRLNVFYFITIIRSVSFIVVGIFINQLIARLRLQQRELREQQESLRAANASLVHYASTLENLAVSRERNRLARELHDTLAHTLSGLSVQLETVKAYRDVDLETARALLNQALDTTRSGLNETRRALKALRASPLDDLGLRLALKELCESAADRSRLELELDLPEEIPMLSPDAEQCVYRVAQEAVENVIRHANARRLLVCLDAQKTGLRLTVQDDGTGTGSSVAGENGHFGLAGMRERAELAGGRLAITSLPHQGTRVELFIQGYRHD